MLFIGHNLHRNESRRFYDTLKEKRIEWKARYDAWEKSGQSTSAWCQDQGTIGCSNLSICFLQN
ncbi:IS66 family insertion sequence element accessory protein TnpA [Caldifermentibacillus hisashii]|uniref:IS66 family insertion sequence element accessory protein TnpA n=1 Tax=Caldifermentibacillus hisashii TaxID=996558 RepID=UPI003857AE36